MEDKQLGMKRWDKAADAQINVCLVHPGVLRLEASTLFCLFVCFGGILSKSALVVYLRPQHYLFNKPFLFDSNKCP